MKYYRIATLIIASILFSLLGLPAEPVLSPKNESISNLVQYTTKLISDFIPTNYNKDIRPNYGEGTAIQVNISLLINDISAISETAMEYKVDFYIRHYWNDHRLTFPIKHNVSQLTLGEDFVKKIWLPDSYFDNAKENVIHKTALGQTTTLIRIKSNGDILYSTRVALIAQCPMDLTFFPLDQQKCSIEISSYGHSKSELFFRWYSVEINKRIFMPTFHLLGYNKFELENEYKTGTFTTIVCDIFLARSIGYYVSQVYIPTILIVIISWIPFWLERNDNHARVGLGVTTVLTMTTLTTSTSSDFPKISYLKAIDVYLFAGNLMVFLSLIEYAVVGYYEFTSIRQCICNCANQWQGKIRGSDFDENHNGTTKSSSTERKQIKSSQQEPNLFQTNEAIQQQTRKLIKDTSVIDQWARWLFPGTFLVFNLIYVFGLCLFVSINSQHDLIQTKF